MQEKELVWWLFSCNNAFILLHSSCPWNMPDFKQMETQYIWYWRTAFELSLKWNGKILTLYFSSHMSGHLYTPL